MRTQRSALATLAVVIIAATCLAPAGGGPAAPADGRAILARAAEFYEGLQSVRASAEIRIVMPEGLPAMGGSEPERYLFALARPASASAVPTSDMPAPSFVQDGMKQYAAMPMFRRYVLADAVPFETLLQPTEESPLMVPGFDLFVGFAADSGELSALRGAAAVESRGSEEVAGKECHHLAVDGPGGGFEIWIASGKRPWVMRYRKEAPGAEHAPKIPEPEESGAMTMVFEPGFDIHFSEWSSDAQPEGAFAIRPPEDFERVDVLFPPLGEMGEFMQEIGGEHPSVGQSAPEVTLAPMEGEPVDLAKLKGKVVVLDFWASWCVPCVIELPLVKKVVGETGESSVAFFAVNRGETKKIVSKFLKDRKLELPVVMDHDDKISSAFGVQGMPHLVVIDRAGKVRNVHIGSWPGSEAQLKAEIETLLSE